MTSEGLDGPVTVYMLEYLCACVYLHRCIFMDESMRVEGKCLPLGVSFSDSPSYFF